MIELLYHFFFSFLIDDVSFFLGLNLYFDIYLIFF